MSATSNNVISDKMREAINGYMPRYPSKQAVTLPALHIIQEEMRCVPQAAIAEVADMLELHPSQVHDTLSFYGFFKHETTPLGQHRLWVCRSISCMLRGGEELLVELSNKLGVKPGETSADGKVTLEFAECLGKCEGAPCVLMDDECHGNQTLESVLALINQAGGHNGR
ncbi:MAG: NAD(P)H-dependent oxidoreductase subunit E [Bythopirellula sp.]|mgnify:CR=1 FL=1|nr:NAD(P)H-dependent oxidoreductase subunit E [Bythopirellula sp.]